MKNACKKIMALLLVIAMIIGVLPSVFAASYVKPFTDVKTNDWFAEYVKYVYERDPQLMDGVAPDKFDPEGSCTRAMAAVVIYRLADPVKANYKATFTDLTEDWYMDGIGWAQKNKVVDGVGDNKFDPDGLLTREQLVTMIWRYAGEPDASPKNIKSFPDYKEVSDWAVDAFNWAIEEEIIGGSDIEGVDYLLPAGNATRAQFAKIISIYAQSLGCEEHNWDEGVVTKEPTCTEKGEKTLTCKECGETKDVEVPALDHDWDEGAVTKEATCTEEGAKTLTCKRCKETKSEVIPALGHVDEDPADGKCDNCGEDMPVPPSGDFVLSTELKDGAEVVIYNPGHGMAIKNENDNNWYLVPQTITPADGKIAEPDASLVWTIVDNGNGTYSFVNGENKIMCWVSGNYFELTNDANYADANGNWKILPADAATSQFFIQHESFSNSYGPAYIECYYNAGKDKTNIAGYSSGNPGLADFGFQFYIKGASAPCTDHVDANNDGKCDNCGADITPPPPPSGDFVLSTDLKDGAEVVIYNPGHGMAIKNENDNNWYLVPQTITPADNKIAEPDASLVWTIVDNGNGTYSFVNGENKIMCWVSGNYFELTNDANYADANGNWKILPADAATSQFFIQHESFSNSYGPAYIECYYNAGKDKTNIAGYSSGNPGLADFGFQFYIKGASAPCTDHVDANNDGKCDNCGTELTPPPPPVGDATFTKVTGDQTDWSGTYVIGYTADGKTLIFNGAADADGNHIETVANGDTVTVSAEYAVVVAKSGSGYTFSAKGGYMDGKMYNGSLSNGLAFSATPAVGNMSWNAEKGIVEMQSAQGSIFRYNNGEIQNAPGTFYSWFRFYKPASSVQTPVEFYKLDDGVTPPPPPVAEGIDIYFTNDVHGAYENYAYAAEIMKDADLKIDAGDNIQGSVAASLTKGQCMVDLIDLIGYDVCVPGNHEFDFGFDRFLEIADIDNEYSPYICANLYDLVNDEYAMYPAAVYEIDGKIVAVIGVTTPETLVKSTPAFFQDGEGNWIYDFCNDNDGTLLYECIQEVVDLCREDPDYPADYVILAGHLGIDEQSEPWTSTSVIANTTGIDAVIDGHSHSTFTQTAKNKDGKDVVVAQTGTKLENVGHMVIAEDGTITSELIPVSTEGAADEAVAAKVAAIKAEVDEISNTVIAKSEVDLTVNDPDTGKRAVRNAETNLGDLCADAYRDLLGCDIAFVNGGGVRANIAAGDVTYGQIIAVHPFGNMACEIEVTGQQILEALELGAAANPGESGGFLQVSGISFTIDQNVPSPVEKNDKGEFTGLKAGAPNRIKDVKVGGVALDLAATYTLGGHNYMLKQGGDGFTMFKGCTVLKDEIAVDNEVLIRYIRDTLKGVVAADSIYANPKGEGRITIIAKAACEHTLTAAPALAATCTEKGYEAYWFCSKCNAVFSDAEGKNEIATLVMIDALGHIDANDDGKCDRCDAAMPVAGSNFVLSTTLEDGDQVVIYNPGHGKAIKNETDRDWYLIAEAITPVDGVITEPDASLVWTYNDNLDGTYSFTNGTDMIVCWVSGNYFELTNDANYANANGNWKIIAADEATSQFYIQHESFSNSYGPAYIECYTKTDGDKISGYSSSNPGLADFGFQFYVLGGEPVVVCTHDWEETDSVDATCTAAGSISYECTLCDATKTDTIAALGHVDDDKDGVCDREGCGYVYPAAGEGYVKVTADQEDWSGTYLIVYEYADGTAKVFNGLDASGEYVTLDSITDNTIAFQEGMCAVVVEKMEGGYSVKVGEQYMYDKGASSNGTNFGATPKATTFASNEDGTVTMTCNTCIFRFNTNGGTNNDRFRYYKSTSTSFPLICLYKLG